MSTVEPIRDLDKIRQNEKMLLEQSLRNSLIFMMGINCGLRSTDILNPLNDVCKEINLECNVGKHTMRKTFGITIIKNLKT